jgi:hypothetical protein
VEKIITRFDYSYLRNETHVGFHTSVNALFVEYTPETLGIETLYPAYRSLFNEEVEALDVIRRSGLTMDIAAQDRVRGRLYRGFSNAVKGYRNHFDPAKRQAAEKLKIVLKHYGNIARKALDDETVAIEDLQRELVKPENAVHVSALGLGEWLGQLVQANRQLDGLMINRYEETAKRPHAPMRGIRKELDRQFRLILDLLELKAHSYPESNRAFLSELNAVMQRHKDVLAQEAGRRHQIKDLGAGGHTVIEPVATQPYSGKPITPIPKVCYHTEGKPDAALVFAKDFTLTYRNNTNAGMAELTVHGKGEYKGKKMTTFWIAGE